jgi:hypothetical protein
MKKIIFGLLVTASLASCSVTSGLTATGNSIKSADKTGTSKATLLFGFIPLGGDASISTAAKNGNIDKIATVDVTHTNILFLVQTIETKVTGQKP